MIFPLNLVLTEAIEQTEIAFNKTRSPLMMACDDGVEICPVKYGRTKPKLPTD